MEEPSPKGWQEGVRAGLRDTRSCPTKMEHQIQNPELEYVRQVQVHVQGNPETSKPRGIREEEEIHQKATC